MNWLDIVLLVLLGLSALSGFTRGLLRSVTGLAGLVLSFGVAYIYYRPVAAYLEQTFGLGQWLTDYFLERLSEQGPGEPITVMLMGTIDGASPLDLLLQLLLFGGGAGIFGEAVAGVLAATALNVIAFLVIFFAINLVVGVVAHWIPAIPLLAPLDRTGGFFFGLIRGFLVGAVLVGILKVLTAAGGVIAPSPFSAALSDSWLAPSYENAFDYLLRLIVAPQDTTI